MTTVEDLALYFYIASGIAAAVLIILFILVAVLFVRVNRLISDKCNITSFARVDARYAINGAFIDWLKKILRLIDLLDETMIVICRALNCMKQLQKSLSNQLARQKEMMADFCYTNPTIVPGEELSRRGFSMYSGSNHFTSDEIDTHHHAKDYSNHDESRSKF